MTAAMKTSFSFFSVILICGLQPHRHHVWVPRMRKVEAEKGKENMATDYFSLGLDCYNKLPWTINNWWVINNRNLSLKVGKLEGQDQGARMVGFCWVPSSWPLPPAWQTEGELAVWFLRRVPPHSLVISISFRPLSYSF